MADDASEILGSLGLPSKEHEPFVDPLDGLLDCLRTGPLASSPSISAPQSRPALPASSPQRHRASLSRLGVTSDEDMVVTSSASEPSAPASPSSPRSTSILGIHPVGTRSQPIIVPRGAPAHVSTLSTTSHKSGDVAGRAAPHGLHDRAEFAQMLCALQALKPAELNVLLSDWQRDWLVRRDDHCPPPALNVMLGFQSGLSASRPRRQRRSERNGTHQQPKLEKALEANSCAPGRATTALCAAGTHVHGTSDAPRVADVVATNHGRLAEWRRTFLRE